MTKASAPRRARRTAAKSPAPQADVAVEVPAAEPPATEEETDAAKIARLSHTLMIAEQQRDILSRQVDSLVQRLAGQHVASGSFDMAAAQGFVQKEILPINQVLAQIAAQPQAE